MSLLSILLCAPLLPLAGQQQADPVTATYHAAYAAQDAEGLADLWQQHPGRILVTIDADLEGSLAAWEKDPKDEEAIAALQARAVWAAEIASSATGRGIFHDYAASFVGWNDEERGNFRAGQRAYGASRKALGESKFDQALEQGQTCLDLAAPLGDWWGSAMGHSAVGRALLALDRPAEASAHLGQARLLYAGLGLTRNELAEIQGLVQASRALERWQRVRALAQSGLELVTQAGQEDARAAWLKARLEAEQALGLDEAAQATQDELGS